MHRYKPLALRRAELEARIGHAERPEDVLVEIAFEPLAAYLFDHLASKIDIDAVFPAIARVEIQRCLKRLVLASDDPRQVGVFLVTAGILVPDVVGVSCSVSQQLPQGDGPLGRAELWRTRRVEPFQHLR